MAAATKKKLFQVGTLAKRVGKTVRAIHLYEEHGLLEPVGRSAGGFRMFDESSVARIEWIQKLQTIGFSLTEIQEFVSEFNEAETGRDASRKVRDVFSEKLRETRDSIERLRALESDLEASIAYLDSCNTCAPVYQPTDCRACNHDGHRAGKAPALFAELSGSRLDQDVQDAERVDVDVVKVSTRGDRSAATSKSLPITE